MVDTTLVLRKLSELDQYQEQLSEFAEISIADYRDHWKTQRIVERTLQMMLEVCVDIANHVISDKALRTPKSYADVFAALGEAGILSEQDCVTMQEMAKFRNVLVHGYDKVDELIVVDILNRRLPDFCNYRDAIVAFLG